MKERILIIEDEKLLRWSLKERLTAEGFDVFEAPSGESARQLMKEDEMDLLLVDYRLPDTTGVEVLRSSMESRPDVPVIMMTAYSTVETAVEAIKLGAFDYINKPFNQDEMVLVVQKALETSRLRREVRAQRREQEERYGLSNIVGDSQSMREVFRMIRKVGRSAASTVLITPRPGQSPPLASCRRETGASSGPMPGLKKLFDKCTKLLNNGVNFLVLWPANHPEGKIKKPLPLGRQAETRLSGCLPS